MGRARRGKKNLLALKVIIALTSPVGFERLAGYATQPAQSAGCKGALQSGAMFVAKKLGRKCKYYMAKSHQSKIPPGGEHGRRLRESLSPPDRLPTGHSPQLLRGCEAEHDARVSPEPLSKTPLSIRKCQGFRKRGFLKRYNAGCRSCSNNGEPKPPKWLSLSVALAGALRAQYTTFWPSNALTSSIAACSGSSHSAVCSAVGAGAGAAAAPSLPFLPPPVPRLRGIELSCLGGPPRKGRDEVGGSAEKRTARGESSGQRNSSNPRAFSGRTQGR